MLRSRVRIRCGSPLLSLSLSLARSRARARAAQDAQAKLTSKLVELKALENGIRDHQATADELVRQIKEGQAQSDAAAKVRTTYPSPLPPSLHPLPLSVFPLLALAGCLDDRYFIN